MAVRGGEDDGLLTPKQAAAFLKVNIWTLRRWIREGRFSVVNLSHGPRAVLRFRRAALEQFIDAHMAPMRRRRPRDRKRVASR